MPETLCEQIDKVADAFHATKDRKKRTELKKMFEYLVQLDIRACGFNRWNKLR